MKKVIGPFVIAWVLMQAGSCGSRGNLPEGILDRQQMVRALTEVYIAEEKVRQMNLKTDSGQLVFDSLQERIMHKVSVSDSTLKQSFDYYMDHPKELQAIYATLIDSLNLQEQRANIKKEEPRDTVKVE